MNNNKRIEDLVEDFIKRYEHFEFINKEQKILQIPGRDYHIHIEDLFNEEKILIEFALIDILYSLLDIPTPNSEEEIIKWLSCCEVVYKFYNDLLLNSDAMEFKNQHDSDSENNKQKKDRLLN